MPIEGWIPVAALRLIFRHVVVAAAIIVALAGLGWISKTLVPGWQDEIDLIDGWMTMAILVVIAVKLVWGFFRGEGAFHVLAAA